VLIRDQAWGNLYTTGKRGGDFSDADEEVVAILAEWAGIAIENARHFKASEDRRAELERTVRRLEATTAIARAIGGETDLDRVLELIATRSRALVEAHGIVILLREPPGLLVAATAGQVPHSVRGARLELPEDASDDALRSALTVLEVQTGESLVVPLRFRGRSVGMLVALGRTGDAESLADDGEDLLLAFAASAATAVATARSVEAQRLRDSVEGAESERGRWARELHDETLQGLGGLRILISAARRHQDAGAAHETFDELATRIDAEIDGLRSLIRELRPAALDELGPGPAIEELAARLATGRDLR
jgi:signal transduction histidine kinase